jgi:hypothetical protein
MTSLWALLRHNHNYRRAWVGQVVSEMGDYFNNIAVFALVMEKSGSGLVVSGVMLSRAIPAMLAGPVAGVLLGNRGRSPRFRRHAPPTRKSSSGRGKGIGLNCAVLWAPGGPRGSA